MAKKSVKLYHLVEVGEKASGLEVRTFKSEKEAMDAWKELFPDWQEEDIELGNYWSDMGDMVCVVESKIE